MVTFGRLVSAHNHSCLFLHEEFEVGVGAGHALFRYRGLFTLHLLILNKIGGDPHLRYILIVFRRLIEPRILALQITPIDPYHDLFAT